MILIMGKNEIILKGGTIEKSLLGDGELSMINELSINELTEDSLFVFKMCLCDNEVDRQMEAFTQDSLKNLAGLFVGRTVIKDHVKQSGNQVARIYRTEVEVTAQKATTGEDYARLVAYCYMAKTDSNKDLITDIQAGIKKEVSVGCRMAKAQCSICGIDNKKSYCEHFGGKIYDGKSCYFKLLDAQDAYEVSFVAVPAQPQAGTIKSYTGEDISFEETKAVEEPSDLELELKLIDVFVDMKKMEEENQ